MALAALVAFVRFFPVEVKQSGADLIFFGKLKSEGPPRELVLSVVFLVVAAAMAFIAEGVARTFVRFDPLEAYRLDIIGSIAGIVGFSILSFLGAPPVAWGVIAGGLFIGLFGPPSVHGAGGSATGGGGRDRCHAGAGVTDCRRELVALLQDRGSRETPVTISANGVPHQLVISPSREYTGVYERIRLRSQDDVLIIGAGAGNDVAFTLRNGARHIDAVEIDPRIHEIGTEIHPDRPYDDPRVESHIQDGRAFLERTDRRYDLIIFALPDSITLVAGQSSLRLESYLFTREAIEVAREHLKPGGAFAMYNAYREPWLLDRFAGTVADVFDRRPCVDKRGNRQLFAVIVNSNDPRTLRCASTWQPVSDPFPRQPPTTTPFRTCENELCPASTS